VRRLKRRAAKPPQRKYAPFKKKGGKAARAQFQSSRKHLSASLHMRNGVFRAKHPLDTSPDDSTEARYPDHAAELHRGQ